MKLSILILLAITLNVTLGMTFRHKRHSDTAENEIDNRYGWEDWERPSRPNQGWRWPQRPGRPWPQFPEPSRPRPQIPTAAPALPNQPATTTTQAPLSATVQQCIRTCPVTSEYNPVCGTDLQKYNNPGRLECAKACGVNVEMLRYGQCPVSTSS